MMITWWMTLGGNLPLGHDALLFSTSGTGYFICRLLSHGPFGWGESRWSVFQCEVDYRSTVKHTNHQTTRSPSNAEWTLHNNCYLQPLLAVGSQFCFPRWSCRPDAAPSACVWVICEVMVTVTFPRTVSDGWPWPWCHLWMTLPFVASESRLCPWYGLQAKVDQWLNKTS